MTKIEQVLEKLDKMQKGVWGDGFFLTEGVLNIGRVCKWLR
jgi:hypothetical protein